MKGSVILFFFTLCVLFGEAVSQIKSGENVVIDNPIKQNLYVAGGTVTINAPVLGDLVAAGGTIVINDSIYKDVLVAGGNVTIKGFVGDDIRCAGGSVRVSGEIVGDLVIAGGTITVDKSATIYGDLLVSGGEIVMEGRVRKDIQSASGELTMNGVVDGDADFRGGLVTINGTINGNSILAADKIILGRTAAFYQDVHYWNEEGSLDFQKSLRGSRAAYDPLLSADLKQWHSYGYVSVLFLLWYLGAAFLILFLIQYLFSKTLKNAAIKVKDASIKSIAMGLMFLIGVPLIIVVSMISIIAIPIGIFLFIGYVSVLLVATAIVSLTITHWINHVYYRSAWDTIRIVFVAFGIFISLKLATLTPIIGPLIMMLLVCMAFGGILQGVKWKTRLHVRTETR